MAYSEGNEFGYADLILLDRVTEEDTNDNLKLRFQKGKVCACGSRETSYFACMMSQQIFQGQAMMDGIIYHFLFYHTDVYLHW